MSWAFVTTWPWFVTVALVAYWVVVAVVVLTDDREPTETLAWLLVLFAFPVVGIVFYALFGRNWRKIAARDPRYADIRRRAEPVLARIRARYARSHDEALRHTSRFGLDHIVRTIQASDGATALPAYDVRLLVNGEQKFSALLADMREATDTINLQYFIWGRDDLTAQVTEILLERMAAGVQVRMVNDRVGNLSYRQDEIARLRRAGMAFHWDEWGMWPLNNSNHRKIVVIDGTIGYTGGINMASEYIDGGTKYPFWRDTHLRFEGPAVAELQKMFATSWFLVSDECLFTERFFPQEYPMGGGEDRASEAATDAVADRALIQTVSSGADVEWDPARRAHMVAIADSRERVWIQSPYFVPTPDMYSALIDAALSGVDVRIMMTAWPDRPILTWWAAESFFRPLVAAGAKIYRYQKGFMHAKTIVVDGRIAAVGTLNIDVRSLALNSELMSWVYDDEFASLQEKVFLDDLVECEEVTLQMIDLWSTSRRLRNAAARLASNLL